MDPEKDKESDPLIEWNRLNKENAMHGFVSSLYQSVTETTGAVDKFSIWLLAGTGITGALLITQIESVIPHLSKNGFQVCLLFLVLSAVSGFVAKYKALRCEIQTSVQLRVDELLSPVLDKHFQDKKEIDEYAEQRGLKLDTELDISQVISEFSRPFPGWVKFLIRRKLKAEDRQSGYHVSVKAYASQLNWTFIQAVFFLLFILAGAWFAGSM